MKVNVGSGKVLGLEGQDAGDREKGAIPAQSDEDVMSKRGRSRSASLDESLHFLVAGVV